jgi:osmotically-inducible protein OsmY
MKTNAELRNDVAAELEFDPRVRDAEIGLALKAGVVTLSGTVNSYAKRLAAETASLRVHGVQAVANELKVVLPTSFERTDTDIAHSALNALKWHIEIPDDRITLTVTNGFVTLEGMVEWQFQRRIAEDAVSSLTGVKGVLNRIAVKPKAVSPKDVTMRIKNALHRSAERDAERVTVESHDGKVVLKGSVSSWAERQDIERAAWSAPGVTAVEDDLLVQV